MGIPFLEAHMVSGTQKNDNADTLRRDIGELILQNNKLLMEIKELREQRLNSEIAADFFKESFDQQIAVVKQQEQVIETHKDKVKDCRAKISNQQAVIQSQMDLIDNQEKTISQQIIAGQMGIKTIKSQKEKIITCQAKISNQSSVIQSQRERIDDQKQVISTVKTSFSFLFGQAFVNAVKKPGINTILLPYRWIRLTFRQLKW